MPRVLLAPDKFKGALTAAEICQLLEQALPAAWADPDNPLEFDFCPISDGGEGFVEACRMALGGTVRESPVTGPMRRPVTAAWADCGNVAVAEMASASGLQLVDEGERDPWRATTAGTGQLLRDIARQGHARLVLGIGGSATNDGGAGMAEALGFQFLDDAGRPVDRLPEDLLKVRRIVPPAERCWPEILVACDVRTPLLGDRGATRLFGSQKGVRPEEFSRFEERFHHLVELVRRDVSAAPFEDEPGSGAAGGLGYGLRAFCGAALQPGLAILGDFADLERRMNAADVIITGEGRLDASSLEGKAPLTLAAMARILNKPVVLLCGAMDGEIAETLRRKRTTVLPISPAGLPVESALREAPALLAAAAPRICEAIRLAVSP